MNWIQATEEFHKFRGKGIGSSDMPVIMGVSPWKKPFSLWQEKSGIKKDTFKGNYATKRGQDLEPMVRAWYNNEYSTSMIPESAIHPEYEYLRCNADGVDHSAKKMIEIKCGNLDDHIEAALHQKIPDKYYPQVMFLSFIFGYPIDYVSYNENYKESPFVVVPVKPNPEYTESMIKKAHEFWSMIKEGRPPLIDDSEDVIVDDSVMVNLIGRYDRLKTRYDILEKDIKEIKGMIEKRVRYKKILCNGYRISRGKFLSIRKVSDV